MGNKEIYVFAPTLLIARHEIDIFCREFSEYIKKHNKSTTILIDDTRLIPISIACRTEGLRIKKRVRADCLLKEAYKHQSKILKEKIDDTLEFLNALVELDGTLTTIGIMKVMSKLKE